MGSNIHAHLLLYNHKLTSHTQREKAGRRACTEEDHMACRIFISFLSLSKLLSLGYGWLSTEVKDCMQEVEWENPKPEFHFSQHCAWHILGTHVFAWQRRGDGRTHWTGTNSVEMSCRRLFFILRVGVTMETWKNSRMITWDVVEA